MKNLKLSGIQPFTMLDYPGKMACIAFLPGCNFRCGYCHNPEFVLPELLKKMQADFIPAEAFFSFLETRKGLLDGVVVSGGEPTITAALPDLLREIKRRGFLVKLDTNGSFPERLVKLFDEGLVDYVAMDLKTSPEAYAELVKTPIKPEVIRESIELIMNSGIEYEFRSTLMKELHSPDVLKVMADTLTGAERLYLQTFRPATTLDPEFENYHRFTKEEMEGWVKELFEEAVAHVETRGV